MSPRVKARHYPPRDYEECHSRQHTWSLQTLLYQTRPCRSILEHSSYFGCLTAGKRRGKHLKACVLLVYSTQPASLSLSLSLAATIYCCTTGQLCAFSGSESNCLQEGLARDSSCPPTFHLTTPNRWPWLKVAIANQIETGGADGFSPVGLKDALNGVFFLEMRAVHGSVTACLLVLILTRESNHIA